VRPSQIWLKPRDLLPDGLYSETASPLKRFEGIPA